LISIPPGYDQPHKPKVPDEIIEGSTVFLLGQNPGREEEEEGRPYVGATGQVMVREFFPEAGLVRGENVSIGNAVCYRFLLDGKPANKLPSGKVLERAISWCSQHRSIPPSTKLIIASGAAAWRAVGQSTPITDWRGFMSPSPVEQGGKTFPVLGVLHVADLFSGRNRKMLWPSHRDWRKVPLFLAGKWPEPLPEIVGVSHMEEWFAEAVQSPILALDTEYAIEGKELHTIGLGYPGSKVLQLHWLRTGEHSKRRFAALLASYPGRIVLQNAVADIQVLRQAGVLSGDYREIFARLKIEDTMLAHSVLWAEWPHTLEFLASVYGGHPKMKHLSETNPALYNAGDVVDTLSAWEGEEEEFAKDPRSRIVYRSQPIRLLPLIMQSHERGIRVNKERVRPALVEYVSKMGQASQLAKSYTGRSTFNVGSDDQLKAILYDSEGLPIQRQKSTKKPSIDTDSIAALRRLHDPIPDFEREEREGLEWVEVERRVQDGAHPLLEARVFYAAAQQALTHYILPCYIDRKHPEKGLVGRLFPEFHIHAQANARWSTLNPPMAQLPDDLSDIVMPDEGHMWFKYDWDQM